MKFEKHHIKNKLKSSKKLFQQWYNQAKPIFDHAIFDSIRSHSQDLVKKIFIYKNKQAWKISLQEKNVIAAFENTLQQLSTRLKKSKETRPCFLLIGRTINELSTAKLGDKPKQGSNGKSTLIENAELDIQQTITQQDNHCQAWLTTDAIYIELPTLLNTELHADYGRALLKLWHSHKKYLALKGILLVMNLFECCQQTGLEQALFMQQLQKNLFALTKKSQNQLPLYVVYTHLDRLRGFNEFFSELSESERHQSFGVFVDTPSEIKQGFADLCQQINDRLIRHLYQQRQAFKRKLVHDFPLQFESLYNPIAALSHILIKLQPYLRYAGLFFTSSQQEGVICDRLATSLFQNLNIKTSAHFDPPVIQKSFFSKELLSTQLPTRRIETVSLTAMPVWKKNSAIAAILLISAVSLFWISQQFKRDLHELKRTSSLLTEAQEWIHRGSDNDVMPEQLLTLLERLKQSKQPSLFHSLPRVINPFREWQTLFDLKQKSYDLLLAQHVLPLLTDTLTTILRQGSNISSMKLYNALKVYLMLSSPEHRDNEFILAWVNDFLNTHFKLPIERQKKLLQLIQSTIEQATIPIKIDTQLIRDTRTLLNKQPPVLLIYSLIKANNELLPATPIPVASIFDNSKNSISISPLYTRTHFETVYDKQIPEMVMNLMQGNWVLGQEFISNVSTETAQDLIAQIQSFYISDYVNWWNLFIYNMNPISFQTIEQAHLAFSNLSQKQSEMTSLISLIQTNTQPWLSSNKTRKIFDAQVSKHFRDNTTLSENVMKNYIPLFHALDVELTQLSKDNDAGQAAFKIAKEHFSEPLPSNSTHIDENNPITQLLLMAKKEPQPVQHWLEQIANNYWQLILNETQKYIDHQWQAEVVPQYQAYIAKRYPITKNADDVISLDEFADFFGPKGTLDRFYETYLKLFINDQDTLWHVKQINGKGLALNDEFLGQIIRSNLIRKMFFNDNKAGIALGFSLEPISFEPLIKDLVFNINGQRIFTYQGSKRINHFNWPQAALEKLPAGELPLDKLKDEQIELMIDTVNNEQHKVIEKGPWALFKFLEKANLTPLPSDTQTYEILLALNGSAAKFKLTADKPINPFIPDVINKFELPMKLNSG